MEFVGAEVDIAREFANDFEIASGDAVGPEWRNSLQGVAQTDRTKIDVEAEFFSQGEQAAFGAIGERERVPLRPADGAEQNCIGFAAFRESGWRQRRAERVDGGAAEGKFAKFESVTVRGGAILKEMNGGACDFWADAVTGQDCDCLANGTHVFSSSTVRLNSYLQRAATARGRARTAELAGEAVRPRRTWWIKESRSRSVTCFAESASSVAIR